MQPKAEYFSRALVKYDFIENQFYSTDNIQMTSEIGLIILVCRPLWPAVTTPTFKMYIVFIMYRAITTSHKNTHFEAKIGNWCDQLKFHDKINNLYTMQGKNNFYK